MATTPLSLAYAGILAARSAWWERYARTPPLPTVSVGNLTIGGNGKTPFTLFLAARLRQSGLRVGIVSRGYGGQSSRSARLVSDGRHIVMTPLEAGDEPVMLAKSFDGPIAVARRRIDAIELLATNGLAEAALLDDGFQHVRLRRDVDLLLINKSLGFGNGRLLPAGPLRERAGAIRRADILVLIESSGAPNSSSRLLEKSSQPASPSVVSPASGRELKEGSQLSRRVLNPIVEQMPLVSLFQHPAIDFLARDTVCGKPLLRAQLLPSALTYSEKGHWREAPLQLAGRPVVAVSGVANSAGFHAMIGALGAHLLRTLDYPDHHQYGAGDWQNILAAARDAEMLITTEKDLVKLERFPAPELPLYALHLNVTMEEEDERQLLSLIMQRLVRAKSSHQAAGIQGGNQLWH
jgi:tetraacyldisaccharide 4'-kinase